jgi:stress response protein YsnF
VEKRLVPTEEIIIRKTAVRETQKVEADLRRERVDVDEGHRESGGPEVR